MGSIQNTVHYCCVARGNRILYAYGDGDHEMENLASLCLERTPPFHRWYFETTGKRTFCFLIEDGYVYFSIADENIADPEIIKFAENFRDEFKKVTRKGSRGNLSSNMSSEQLAPAVRRLIASLENASHGADVWTGESDSHSLHAHHRAGLSPSPTGSVNGQVDGSSSTKAPLLGKPSKQEKRKTKDHVVAIRDVGLEEHRKSSDRGANNSASTSSGLDSSNQGGAGSLIPQQKDSGSTRIRSASQSIRKKWWRQVRIVLAIDVVVCLVLLAIWLGVCRGIRCVR